MNVRPTLAAIILINVVACGRQPATMGSSVAVVADAPAAASGFECTLDQNINPGPGIEASRCVSSSGYDQLLIKIKGTNGPNGRTGAMFAMEERVSAFVYVNGMPGTFPMACASSVSGSNGGAGECVLTLSNSVNPNLRPENGPSVSQGIFHDTRREQGRIAKAWEVELAFVTPDGRWDSRHGANYHARFFEQEFEGGVWAQVCGNGQTYLLGGTVEVERALRHGHVVTAAGQRYTFEYFGRRWDDRFCVSGMLDGNRFRSASLSQF